MRPTTRHLLLNSGARLPGLALWLDASDASTTYQDSTLTTLASSDGDVVGGWKDKSGAGNHMTQGTTASKPVKKVNRINGLPVLQGDGVDDQLVTGTVNHNIGTGNFHWLFVIRRNASGSSWMGLATNKDFEPALYLRNNVADVLSVWWGSLRTFNTALAVDTPYLVELWRDGTTLKASINGVQEASTFTVSLSMPNNVWRSFTSRAVGENGPIDIGEEIRLNGYSPGTQAALRTYLRQKWALY